MDHDKKLIFIYNADSGAINLVKDFWKKIFKPSSYVCNLCMQTFGAFSMKKDWKSFVNNLNFDVEFLHRDEFELKYGITDAKYPSTYLFKDGSIELIINDEEMNFAKSLDEMEALVLRKISNIS